jgi:hypothetical protein
MVCQNDETVSLVEGTVSTTFGMVSQHGEMLAQQRGIIPTTVATVSTCGEMIWTDDETVSHMWEMISKD